MSGARVLFRDVALAANDAAAGGRAAGDERRQRASSSAGRMRQGFLQTVARRDASLALELLSTTRPQGPALPSDRGARNYRPADKELRLEQSLAMAVMAAKGERQAALELLDEAQRLAGGRVKSSAQINTQLQLARSFAVVEPPRAFDIVEAVVDRVNEIIAAAEVLDGFVGRGESFRDGELVMCYGIASLDVIYMHYGRELAALARADFERTRSAAAKFQRPEVRARCKLLIAEALLSDRQPLESFNDGLLAGGGLAGEGD